MADRAMYHERQARMQCARHALNNLLQQPAYEAAELDRYAIQLGGRLSLTHRWPLLGNYDVNVVMLALQSARPPLEAVWWDARKGAEALIEHASSHPRLAGLLVNCQKPSPWWTLRLLESRHWYAILRRPPGATAGDTWFDLDSNLESPAPLSEEELRRRLGDELSGGGHVFVVSKSQDDHASEES